MYVTWWCQTTPTSLSCVRHHVKHGVNLLCAVSQKAVQVADKAVDISLARRLVDYVLVVVVAQAAAQLFIVHLGLVLPLAPAPSHLEGRSEDERWERAGEGQIILIHLIPNFLWQDQANILLTLSIPLGIVNVN